MTRLTLDIPESAFATLHKDPLEFTRKMRIAAAVKWYELELVSQGRAAFNLLVKRVRQLDFGCFHGAKVKDRSSTLFCNRRGRPVSRGAALEREEPVWADPGRALGVSGPQGGGQARTGYAYAVSMRYPGPDEDLVRSGMVPTGPPADRVIGTMAIACCSIRRHGQRRCHRVIID